MLRVIFIILGFIMLPLVGTWQQQTSAVPRPFLARINPKLLPVFTLGQRRLYDDYLLIWLTQNLNEEKIDLAQAQQKLQIAMSVVQLRPHFQSAYLMSCFLLAFEYRHPEFCEAVITPGMKEFPDDWLLPAILGYMFAYPLKNTLKGSAYYARSALRKGAPAYIGSLAKRLATQAAATEQDLESREELHRIINSSPDVRQILDRLTNPQGKEDEP
jgi:hypothetical protein